MARQAKIEAGLGKGSNFPPDPSVFARVLAQHCFEKGITAEKLVHLLSGLDIEEEDSSEEVEKHHLDRPLSNPSPLPVKQLKRTGSRN